MERNHYKKAFQEVLGKLNQQQLKAVNKIEGPVLVVAGPGTGKTQILAARIGKILQETDASAYNILCLTYTDAGAIAMRQRLETFIGPEAYNVNIFTFHAFCNMVIQENLDYFGIRGLQAISELEQLELFYKLIDSFDLEHPLKKLKGDIYYEKTRLKALFECMKKESWSKEYLLTEIQVYLDDLPNRDKFIYKKAVKKVNAKKGDIKLAEIKKETDKMQKIIAAVNEFENFQEIVQKASRYDFNDMILMVIEAFKNEESILLKYQERFLYFLVDEFQDTNGAQIEILNMLTDYWDTPNVFVVGDDDQAIYRFQGANLKNILDFHSKHKEDIEIIVLEDNYRSQQIILDYARELINHNEERLTKEIPNLHKNLTSNTVYQVSEEVKLYAYQTQFQEEMGILTQIQAKHKEGVPYSDMAIIYRNHSEVEGIIKLLKLENIPLNIKRRQNILELPLIKQLLNFFNYLTLEREKVDSGEFLLFEMMHYPYLGINTKDASKIARRCSFKLGELKMAWRSLMSNEKELKEIGVEKIESIIKFDKMLGFWMNDQFNHTIQVVLEKILTQAGIIEYCMNHPERNWMLKVITSFFDFLKEETAKNPQLTIKKLLDTCSKMEKNGIPIMVNQWSQTDDGLNLVTAHSSKGLEYNYVFILGMISKKWEKKASRVSSGYSLPDTCLLYTSDAADD